MNNYLKSICYLGYSLNLRFKVIRESGFNHIYNLFRNQGMPSLITVNT